MAGLDRNTYLHGYVGDKNQAAIQKCVEEIDREISEEERNAKNRDGSEAKRSETANKKNEAKRNPQDKSKAP